MFFVGSHRWSQEHPYMWGKLGADPQYQIGYVVFLHTSLSYWFCFTFIVNYLNYILTWNTLFLTSVDSDTIQSTDNGWKYFYWCINSFVPFAYLLLIQICASHKNWLCTNSVLHKTYIFVIFGCNGRDIWSSVDV